MAEPMRAPVAASEPSAGLPTAPTATKPGGKQGSKSMAAFGKMETGMRSMADQFFKR